MIVFQALGVDAVAGMIIMLGFAIGIGVAILFCEHAVYKHALPYFRKQPRGTIWRSPNLMFFSQVLKLSRTSQKISPWY